MNNNIIIGAVVVVLIVLAGGYLLTRDTTVEPTTQITTSNVQTPPVNVNTTTSGTTTSPAVPKKVTVNYTSTGFSPQNITIAKGDMVTFVSVGSSSAMWVASDPHPTHEAYDGTTLSTHCATGYAGPVLFDQCQEGDAYSLVFTKAGTWKYHNHRDSTDTGTVTVK